MLVTVLRSNVGKGWSNVLGIWVIAGLFIVLGMALNLKVREITRNHGRETEDYPGVPQ